MIDKHKETSLGSWVRHEFDFDKGPVIIFPILFNYIFNFACQFV
jgi:hypothetical protein